MPERIVWRARHFWHFLVWMLIWTSAWDAFGLLSGGNSWFVGPSYSVLRLLSAQIGGMRALGVPLGVVCLVLILLTTWSYGRHSYCRHPAGRPASKLFPLCLSLIAGWYAVWTVGILWANVNELIHHHTLIGWTSLSKLGFVCTVAIRMASLPPPPPGPYGRHRNPAPDGGTGRDVPG